MRGDLPDIIRGVRMQHTPGLWLQRDFQALRYVAVVVEPRTETIERARERIDRSWFHPGLRCDDHKRLQRVLSDLARTTVIAQVGNPRVAVAGYGFRSASV